MLNKANWGLYKNKSGIYSITNIANNKIYIGSAINVYYRWNIHISDLKNNKHGNKYLQYSFNKYNEQNFKFEVIELIEDIDKLLEREQYYLDIYFDKQNNCYNISPTAGSNFGIKFSEETRLKVSKSLIGNKRNLGNKHNNNTKNKMSISHGSKPFLMYKIDGTFVGEFYNKSDVARKYNLDDGNIYNCLESKKSYRKLKDYIFIYKDIFSQEILDKKLKEINAYNFNMYKKDGTFIGSFNNQSECARLYNLYTGSINSCLKGKLKSTKGYVFKYVS